MNTATAREPAIPEQRPAIPVQKPTRARALSVSRWPFQFHYSISPAMQESIERLSGQNSLMTAAQIGRLSLHVWLAQNDPAYAKTLGAQYE